MTKRILVVLILALAAVTAGLPALAADDSRHPAVLDDKPVIPEPDPNLAEPAPAPEPTDQGPIDGTGERPHPTDEARRDGRNDRAIDVRTCLSETERAQRCCPDRPVDRIPERCKDHAPDQLSPRQMILRLIQNHEWEKLWQLLQRLGLI